MIAMVATAVMVSGVRTIIQPGQELPELPEHDEKELVDSGAALDPAAQAASDKARQQEEQFAQQTFQEARERAMAQQASITLPTTEQSTATPAASATGAAPAADAPAASATGAAPAADATAASATGAAPAADAPAASATGAAPAADATAAGAKAAGKSQAKSGGK